MYGKVYHWVPNLATRIGGRPTYTSISMEAIDRLLSTLTILLNGKTSMNGKTMLSLSSATQSSSFPRLHDIASTEGRKRRKVHFGPLVVIQRPNLEGAESKLSPWLSRDEFRSMLSKAVWTAVESRKFVLSDAIDKAMIDARRVASALTDQQNLQHYLESMDDISDDLRLWCQYGHSRRGLEKVASRRYQDRKMKEKLFEQVASLSKAGAQPEVIRAVSECISRPSIILARMFGVADAKAVADQGIGVDIHRQCLCFVKAEPNANHRADVTLTTTSKRAF